jgi:hypothetical protein
VACKSPRASKAFGRAHGLFGGLSVDVKNLGKSKDEIGLLIRRHEHLQGRCAADPTLACYFALQRSQR